MHDDNFLIKLTANGLNSETGLSVAKVVVAKDFKVESEPFWWNQVDHNLSCVKDLRWKPGFVA